MARRADVDWWQDLPVMDEPSTLDALVNHLAEHHAPFPVAPGDAWRDLEYLALVHRGEHNGRHPAKGEHTHSGHLRHTHPAWLPKSATKQAAA